MRNSHILSAAIGSLLVLGLVSGNANAADKKDMEKCFGIAKAGMQLLRQQQQRALLCGTGDQNNDPQDLSLYQKAPAQRSLTAVWKQNSVVARNFAMYCRYRVAGNSLS